MLKSIRGIADYEPKLIVAQNSQTEVVQGAPIVEDTFVSRTVKASPFHPRLNRGFVEIIEYVRRKLDIAGDIVELQNFSRRGHEVTRHLCRWRGCRRGDCGQFGRSDTGVALQNFVVMSGAEVVNNTI